MKHRGEEAIQGLRLGHTSRVERAAEKNVSRKTRRWETGNITLLVHLNGELCAQFLTALLIEEDNYLWREQGENDTWPSC